MRVLITTEFYLPFQCGVTTAVLNERKCLETLGHEVRILTIAGSKKSYFKDGVYYMRSNLPKLYKDSNATLAFWDSLLDDVFAWHPDLVHSQCEFFTMVYAKKVSRKLHIPLVHTCHTDFDEYGVHFTKSDRLWKWLTSTSIPKLLKRIDYIICPTQKTHDLLVGYGVKNPIETFPSGVDLWVYRQSLSEDERFRRRTDLGVGPDDTVFVSVCRLSEEKKVDESIEHFASLHKECPATKLLIVGDGTMRHALESQVQDAGLCDAIRFIGNVKSDEVWKYYKASDIFISSSLSETQGLTYIEALACGIPIVCRKDQALDISLIPGVNGFDFTDDESFKKAVLPLIDNPDMRAAFGKAAADSVEKFSLETFASNLLRVFNTVLEKRHDGTVC